VTAVPQNAMASGASVSKAAVPVTSEQLASAPVNGTAPPTGTVPQKSAVTGNTAAAASVKAPPAAVENRAVVAKTAPPPAAVPFAQKQQALAENGGKPLAPAQENQLRQSAPQHQSLIKPAANTNGGGLQPAREGLAAAQPVQAGNNGFVDRPAKTQTLAAAKPVGQPATASRVPQPPEHNGTPAVKSVESKPEPAPAPKPKNKKGKKAPPPPKEEEKKPEKGRG
jgi:hypothetical protein